MAVTSHTDSVRVHLTNIAGTGATQLVSSLLPAVEASGTPRVSTMYVPDRGLLANYVPQPGTNAVHYRRALPNSVSRFLECTILGSQFDGPEPLLVLGDLPLACRAPQTVFLQTTHLLQADDEHAASEEFRYRLARHIFRRNARRARSFIVQTELMRDRLERSYPEVRGKVHVVPQPVPQWMKRAGARRCNPEIRPDGKLKLAYPAAGYPHKNHQLLSRIANAAVWPVRELVLTLNPQANPAPHISWIRCTGHLDEPSMVRLYEEIDALLFLSTMESYGFPLVEAMFLGLPIVSPDLPYARSLCGREAIYFDHRSEESLRLAVRELQRRLSAGWRPDWTLQLSGIPTSWEEVATRMLAIACSATPSLGSESRS